MVGLESVARPGIVRVFAPIFLQHVVEAVFNPTEAERWPILVALTGVVVDNIQNYFDAGTMQFFHHGSKLIQADKWVIAAAVSEMRGKEGHWPISPVVSESRRSALSIELEHRQEFDS